MAFLEKLPNGCPPPTAHDGACEIAFRFVLNEAPGTDAFASQAALASEGEKPPAGVDLCRWSSCSMYLDMETVAKKRKIKSLQKYPFVAQLKIQAGSGHILENNKHIDFWMYDTFDPLAAIVVINGVTRWLKQISKRLQN
jgi:hypothetical protein